MFLLLGSKDPSTFSNILKINQAKVKNPDMLDVHDGDIKDVPGAREENGNKNIKRNAIRDRKALWFTRDIPYTFGKHGGKHMYR